MKKILASFILGLVLIGIVSVQESDLANGDIISPLNTSEHKIIIIPLKNNEEP